MGRKNGRRTVRTFAWASFLNDLGSDMIYPIWPLFVTTILNANMAVLGLVDGLGEAMVSLSKAFSGYMSDRIRKRKVFVWTGYLFGSLSRVGYAFSTAWQHLIPFRVLDRSGKIRSAPRDAIIADVSTKKNRGWNFGFLRAMDNFGAVIGIIICIALFGFLGYKRMFLLAAIPSVIAAILIIVSIKEKKPKGKIAFKAISLKDMNRDFRLFLFLSIIFALGSFSYSFLLIYAREFGFGISFIPVLYLIFTLSTCVFSIPFGRLTDKIGRKNVLMLAFMFWGLVCLSFIYVRSYTGLGVIFILYGMHKGALEPSQKTFVSELVPKVYRASGLGVYQMAIGLAALPASLMIGLLWDNIDMFLPLYISLCLTITAVILLAFVKEKK